MLKQKIQCQSQNWRQAALIVLVHQQKQEHDHQVRRIQAPGEKISEKIQNTDRILGRGSGRSRDGFWRLRGTFRCGLRSEFRFGFRLWLRFRFGRGRCMVMVVVVVIT